MIPKPLPLALAALGLACAACDRGDTARAAPGHSSEASAAARTEVVVLPPREMADGNFPCTDCHDVDLPARTTPRALKKAHKEITLAHGEKMWCFDCHDTKDRDKLRLVGGETLTYEEAPRLCGQCHGAELRDWAAGAHGRRTGHWNGRIESTPCSHCHAAHAPSFGSLQPEPPPPRPVRTR